MINEKGMMIWPVLCFKKIEVRHNVDAGSRQGRQE